MSRNEIESGVRAVLTAILRCENTCEIARAKETEWDSLKHMEIVFAVEEKFCVQFSEEQIPKLDSLSKFVDCVCAFHAARNPD